MPCVRTVSFESSVLDQVADGLPDRAPVPVRFTGMTAVSAAAAQRLRATVDFAWDLVAGNPAAATSRWSPAAPPGCSRPPP